MTMKKKAKQSAQPKKEDPKALRVDRPETEAPADALAHTSLRPTVQAALTLMDYNKAFGELSINTLVADLVKQCELSNNGDLSRAEALLTTQAHTLDAIFHKLARKATHVEYLNQFDVNLRLALKAQSQCRATLETLAAIKNPQPVAFVRQANIAHGPQQVNNAGNFATCTRAQARVRETENPQSKLLEESNGERLDIGTTGAASGNDPALEPVETIHGSQNPRGETESKSKRL